MCSALGPKRALRSTQYDWEWKASLLRTSNSGQQDLGVVDSETEQLNSREGTWA